MRLNRDELLTDVVGIRLMFSLKISFFRCSLRSKFRSSYFVIFIHLFEFRLALFNWPTSLDTTEDFLWWNPSETKESDFSFCFIENVIDLVLDSLSFLLGVLGLKI